ncbi:hypothetical protein DK871_19610 [Pseudomonas sp. L13]|nr:hypothetical protein [Pseudomonas sp. L13]
MPDEYSLSNALNQKRFTSGLEPNAELKIAFLRKIQIDWAANIFLTSHIEVQYSVLVKYFYTL